MRKTASPNPVQIGSDIAWTVVVANDGPSAATSVVVTDTLSSSTTFVSCASTGAGACTGAGRFRKVKFSSLAAGDSATIALVARVRPTVTQGTVIANRVHVRAPGDPSTGDNSAAAAVTAIKPQADVAVIARASADTVTSGSEVTYTISVTNLGPGSAVSVVVRDTLAASMTFVACTASANGSCSAVGQVVTATFPSMPDGGSRKVTITASPGVPPPPYPASPVIERIRWDTDHVLKLAEGSDLWPMTWGPDDNIYTSWGDGGGFGGSNQDGRVLLGFARLSGPPTDFTPVNMWGGKDPLNPATFQGKCTGIISHGGVLYGWITLKGQPPQETRLAWSEDLSATWTLESWGFPGTAGGFRPLTFLNFGKDNAGARDAFVYVYGRKWAPAPDPFAGDHVYLARVDAGSLNNAGAYRYFAGLGGGGAPLWTTSFASAVPVFSDLNEPDVLNAVHVPALNRYLATTAHGREVQKLSIFDAPEPWGPWTTVSYWDNWGELGVDESLLYSIPTRWMSPDGAEMWMVFSASDHDAFNLLSGSLVLRSPFDTSTVPATLIVNSARVRTNGSTDPNPANDRRRVQVAVVN